MDATQGVLFIHSAPSALCRHVEWAVGGALGAPVRFDWSAQGAERATYRTEVTWRGSAGTAETIASALTGWQRLRFEVTEDAGRNHEGQRISYTPNLGVFRASTGPHGDIMVPEDRLRTAMTDPRGLQQALDDLLGTAWDAELEVFRYAGDGAPVRWLHQVV
ncbi:DUF3145 domain-containing protein [Parenemella sanctibonifatiensis]|uniref:DUF3145 domain-containing protein n=1 Tax=Parenemella sanctibonifatiensis TaxID=2016505 RepID=A0A255EH17_9ACTN|nr:DUF3145 domain-containing protein [Parenemella sanctibonifatiensis]OYN90827.1 hypothetical protein CGZ91_04830 [Parenemella sanctibonifatiensis]